MRWTTTSIKDGIETGSIVILRIVALVELSSIVTGTKVDIDLIAGREDALQNTTAVRK